MANEASRARENWGKNPDSLESPFGDLIHFATFGARGSAETHLLTLGGYNQGMRAENAVTAARVDRVLQVSLLLLVANGFLAIASTGALDWFSISLMTAALAWRTAMVLRRAGRPIPSRIPSILALVYLVVYGVELYLSAPDILDVFVPATVRMMFFFTALKLLIAKNGRDYFYLGLLAFLQLLAASMFLLGIGYLVVLLLFLALAIACYTSFEIKRGCESDAQLVEDYRQGRRKGLGVRLAALSVVLTVAVLTLSAGLFLLLPRTLGIAMGGMRAGRPVGFSDEVNLGLGGFLQRVDTPVMRVELLSGGSLEGLRWRGLALEHFDGVRWSNPEDRKEVVDSQSGAYAFRGVHRLAPNARKIEYAVTLEPLRVGALFLAGLAEKIETVSGSFSRLLVNETDSLFVDHPSPQTLRYRATAWLSERRAHRPADVVDLFTRRFRGKYLQLPDVDPRVEELARQVTSPARSPLGKAELLERYLLNEFAYSLELPSTQSDDPLAHFLFERREGHCEYFASAMVVMLRTLGISSRMAVGFAGGVYNPISELQVIRSSDAHAWVEAYIPRYGWLTFDPTPPAPKMFASGWWAESWMLWDALQSSWNDWVIDYDDSRQRDLAGHVQRRSRWVAVHVTSALDQARLWAGMWGRRAQASLAWIPLAGASRNWLMLAAGFVLVGFVAAGWVWLRPALATWYRSRRLRDGRGSAHDCSYLYERAVALLKRRGYRRQTWQTAEDFAESLEASEFRRLMSRINAAYNAARFGEDEGAMKRLPGLVAALERGR